MEKNKHKILKCCQKKDFDWWTNGRKGRNGLSKDNVGFQKGGFRPYQPDKGAKQGLYPEQRQRKVQRKARKKLILNPDFEPLKHLMKKDIAMPGNLVDWSSSQWPDDSWTPAAWVV